MRLALAEAAKAAAAGEVPAGCVIVEPPVAEDGPPESARILGIAHNRTEGRRDATAHAEMLALSAAFKARRNWRLCGARLYATKEPCPMCAGAIVLARVKTVVWGVSDPKRGGGTVFGVFDHPGVNHHPEIVTGVLEAESRAVLKEFFSHRRCEPPRKMV
ncbi:MAG: nucleoside deaminase [Kiritimatiellae bacterium]|nr:nucleoside deaminase [Kiritimatiellia bacterium]